MVGRTPPETLRPLFWSYDFSRIDLERHRKTIIVQVLNYGTFSQWRWLIETYGRDAVRMILGQIPATEIKPRTHRLASLVFDRRVSAMHREVLTKRGADVFAFLGRFDDFYLAGGTGLALQLATEFPSISTSSSRRDQTLMLPRVQAVSGRPDRFRRSSTARRSSPCSLTG